MSYRYFLDNYGDLNDKSLKAVAEKDPDLLLKMMGDENLRPLTRANILQEIGNLVRESDIPFIKGFVDHESPFIRESALRALFDFYEPDSHPARSKMIQELVENRAKVESSEGVKSQIVFILEMMRMADDVS